VQALRRHWSKNPAAFTIAAIDIPRWMERFSGRERAVAVFRDETISLLVSRILMLRFFEDHGFFGKKRYLCNGGINAFGQMRAYFDTNSTEVLKFAYAAGGEVYRDVFSIEDLDWVLQAKAPAFSSTLERALMHLAAFSFDTIQEDILTSIYGSYVEDTQRKVQGEHYTPPGVARYIVARLNLSESSAFLDPACGLGTFLIEAAYNVGIVPYLKRLGVYEEPGKVGDVTLIRGNDLNPVSASFARMQFLWALLPHLTSGKTESIPQLVITGGFDSLRVEELGDEAEATDLTPFSDLDSEKYDAVGGNPPYVRPARREWRPTRGQDDFFSPIGAKSNVFALFVYKAMQHWLKDDGMLGFIIQASLLDARNSNKLRQQFAIGGSWRIVEIVDME
jgi:hypothetical protein